MDYRDKNNCVLSHATYVEVVSEPKGHIYVWFTSKSGAEMEAFTTYGAALKAARRLKKVKKLIKVENVKTNITLKP